ncbi:MAG: zinc ribbon domain-containing protein [Promethearchaeota archaeon]
MSYNDLPSNWYNFGKNIRIVAIFSIFIIIPYFAFIANIILLIFICSAISHIKKINQQQRDPYLSSFSSKYLAAAIIKFIGLIFVNIAGAIMAYRYFMGPSYYYSYYIIPFPFSLVVTPVILTSLVPGFILMIIGCAIEKGGWENLKSYFYMSKDEFPPGAYLRVNEGVSTLSSAALLWALGFLLVPIIIGYIMYIVGYFKLSTLAERAPTFKKQPVPPVIPEAPKPPKPVPPPSYTTPYSSTPETTPSMNFCPHCGAELEKGGRYCGTCGSALYEK